MLLESINSTINMMIVRVLYLPLGEKILSDKNIISFSADGESMSYDTLLKVVIIPAIKRSSYSWF